MEKVQWGILLAGIIVVIVDFGNTLLITHSIKRALLGGAGMIFAMVVFVITHNIYLVVLLIMIVIIIKMVSFWRDMKKAKNKQE